MALIQLLIQKRVKPSNNLALVLVPINVNVPLKNMPSRYGMSKNNNLIM